MWHPHPFAEQSDGFSATLAAGACTRAVSGHSDTRPSTLRDGFGLLGDYGLAYEVNVADLYRGAIRLCTMAH